MEIGKFCHVKCALLQTLQTVPDEMTLCNVSRLQRRYPLGITTGHWGEDTGGVTDVDPDFALD